MKLKPASELSTKKAVDLYTIIVFLGFGFLLFWLSTDRYNDFVETHVNSATNATQITANGVASIINNKQRAVDIFTEDFHSLIAELSINPDDTGLHFSVNDHIKRYLPDFFATNIMNSLGEPTIGDFDGNIGELCLSDMKYFIEYKEPSIRVHPNSDVYHYDLVSNFESNDVSKLFFVSFNFTELASFIRNVKPPRHQLMLIHKNGSDLIEVTDVGSRDKIKERIDFRLNGEEKIRVLSTTPVANTRWHVIDMHEQNLFSNFKENLIREYIIIYIMFSFVAFYMRSILINVDNKRTKAEVNLIQSHRKIKELNNKLEKLSRTDGLTGLYNRRFFDEIVGNEWKRAQRAGDALTCILIDVDFFKQYNDCYGHQAGDDCLRKISNLLSDIFRRSSDIVARYGGEEFIVVMSNISTGDSENTATQFLEELKLLAIHHKDSMVSEFVTISAGLTNLVPTQDNSIDKFIEQADKALYIAKAGGRNQLVVHKHYTG